jgi:putative FmdB family regulatory protein
MPTYEFQCEGCQCEYADLVPFDKTGVYESVECPECGSHKKTKRFSVCAIKFANPRESSKWNNFSYRAGKTMEEAQETRRQAQEASHVGADPYGAAAHSQIQADLNNDSLYGKVK